MAYSENDVDQILIIYYDSTLLNYRILSTACLDFLRIRSLYPALTSVSKLYL